MAKKAEETVVRFRIEGDEAVYEIDPTKLTFGEMARAEALFDLPYDEIPFASARFSLFLLELAVGKVKPGFTGEHLTADEVEFIDSARPTKTPKTSGKQS